VTPFDPVALVAMLQAFYPVVSAGAFLRARAERPEYFAAGTIIGSKGDKLQLPDGRVFDCIYAAGGPASGRRWIAIDVTTDPGGAPDPFPLEPGPLVPLDEDVTFPPFVGESFESIVSRHLDEFGDSDGMLFRAGQTIVESDGGGALDDAYERTIVPAREAHAGFETRLDGLDIVDEIGNAEDHGHIITATSGDYDDEPPADLPEPDPGDPPGDGEPEPPPPPME
jgi:hypothetical protein